DKVEWWDMQGKLFAQGHTFGALLEDLDRFRNSGQADMAAAAQFLQRSCKLDTDFESWHRQLVAESPSPMYWKRSTPGKEIVV
ncbi:hypothetical protein NQU49_27480, partial [Escherichia coli]|uniref:hypothetical protein n=1 Tax=Escherichia coli TaxID=562 RepID=UPI002117E0EB